MSRAAPVPALDRLAQREAVATDSAYRRRQRYKEKGVRPEVNMLCYHEGEAAALREAHALMEAELRRLCNRFQNGQLTVADFGVTL